MVLIKSFLLFQFVIKLLVTILCGILGGQADVLFDYTSTYIISTYHLLILSLIVQLLFMVRYTRFVLTKFVSFWRLFYVFIWIFCYRGTKKPILFPVIIEIEKKWKWLLNRDSPNIWLIIIFEKCS